MTTTRAVKSATFRSGKYKLILDEHWDGLCSHDCPPELDEPQFLYVDCHLTGQRQLETIIHESLHAHDTQASEEYVERAGRDIARLLWRLGYRLDSPE